MEHGRAWERPGPHFPWSYVTVSLRLSWPGGPLCQLPLVTLLLPLSPAEGTVLGGTCTRRMSPCHPDSLYLPWCPNSLPRVQLRPTVHLACGTMGEPTWIRAQVWAVLLSWNFTFSIQACSTCGGPTQ